MRFPAPLLILFLSVACRDNPRIVVPDHLGVGDGATEVVARPQLDIVVRMTRDSTGFNPFDLMQLVVNDVDEAPGMVMGGNWAVFTIPAPGDDAFEIALNRRGGSPIDNGMIVTQVYAGPVIDSVSPATAQFGATVTIAGSGFSAGTVRVWFGGVEGEVTANDDTSITAVVPDGAFRGLVWVLVGDDAAEGIVAFEPLDATGEPYGWPRERHIFAVFPAQAKVESVVRIYGYDYDDEYRAEWGGTDGQRVFNVQRLTVEPIGDIVTCFACAKRSTPVRRTNIQIKQDPESSNHLPFVVLE